MSESTVVDAQTEASIPPAIRKQKRKADAMLAKQASEPVQPAGTPDPTPAPAAQEPQAPAAAPTPEPAKEETKDVDWKAKFDEANQRFNTLQGMMTRELRDLKDQILRGQQPAQAPAAPVNSAQAGKSRLTPEEIDSLGEGTVDVTSRIAEGVTSEATKKVLAEIESLRKQYREASYKSFVAELKSMVTDFDKLNFDPEFTGLDPASGMRVREGFLDKLDDFTGRPLRDLLNEAIAAQDAARAAKFFHRFQQAKNGGKPTPPPRPKLEDHVAPTPSGARVTPTPPPGKPTYTKAFVTQFYEDARRGKYKGKQEEFARTEKAIMEAAAEGRVV